MKIKYLLLFLIAGVLLAGCEKDGPAVPAIVLPSGLSVQVQEITPNSGDVEVSFSAENANFYKIYFGDQQNEVPVVSEGSKVTHAYTASGTYTITVQAHATQNAFVYETQQITIELGNTNGEYPGGYTSPESYEGMNLVWQDEFSGTQLNTTDWVFESGTGSNGWGNNELQYYRSENTKVEDGYLTITAKKEQFGGRQYTSSRIKTQGKKEFQYGRIDIRAALPKGQGIWPALWMLGSNFSTVGWPACGEIDIMELIGGAGKDNTVHGTIHWQHDGNYASYGKGYTLNSGIFNDEFHVFSIVWDATTIKWFVDDVQYNVVDITPAQLSEFHQEFFFIFNVAVGGNWPGSPDANTQFPQKMMVDYVRVFQKQ